MSLPARIARLNTDGTTDTSFAPVAGLNAAGMAVAVLSDGRLMVGGKFTAAAGANRDYLAVLDADGGIDPTVLNANGWVRALTVQADNKVIVVGSFTELDALSRLRIARLSPVLIVEPAYDPRANASLHAVAGQEDGKTIIGGAITSVAGTTRNGIARLLNDAAPQSLAVLSASTVRWLRGGANAETMRVTFEVDTGSGYGSLGGTLARISGGWEVTGLALTGTGTIRARAFPSDSHAGGVIEETVAFDVSPEIEVTVNGGVLTDGAATVDMGDVQMGKSGDVVVTIRNIGLADLTLDATPVVLSGTHAAQWSILAQPASPIGPGLSASFTLRFTPTSEGTKSAAFAIGTDDADEDPFNVALEAEAVPGTGSVDATFQPVINGYVSALAISSVMRVGGVFTTVNGVNRGRYATLSTAGVLATQAGVGANGAVTCLCELLDGRWLIGGAFTTIHGVARTRLARLNADGSLDTSFNVALNAAPDAMLLQPDGAVILTGGFTTCGGLARNGIARILATGAVDSGFSPTVSIYSGHCLALQTDGKFLVGTSAGVTRYHANGTLDSSWTVTAVGYVFDLEVLADGKVLVGGLFDLQRLTSAGVADGTFTNQPYQIQRLALQCDGMVVGGADSVRRFTAGGAVDSSFTTHVFSAMQGIYGMGLQSDGRVIVAGDAGAAAPLRRLLNDAATSALSVTAARVQWLRGGTKAEAQWTAFDLSEDGGTIWTRLGTGTRITGGWELTGLALPSAGRIRARAFVGGALQDEQLIFTGLPVPDLDVTRLVTGAAAASVADGGSVAFAGVLPTQTADVTLKLRNSGLATLSGLTLTMTGAEFTVISLDLTSLEPGQVATAIIRCTPSATGLRSGVLDITSNVPGAKAVYRVGLTGYGITNPAAITDAATLITSTAARLPVRVTANADAATAYVRYRRAGTADAWTLSPVPAWDIAGFTVVPLYRDVGSLIAATSYEFQAVAVNAVSTKMGSLRTFSTLA